MLAKINPSLILVSLFSIRSAVYGATLGDALAITALCAVFALSLYLKTQSHLPINDEVKKEVADLKSSVNALKVARTFGK